MSRGHLALLLLLISSDDAEQLIFLSVNEFNLYYETRGRFIVRVCILSE